ncbi:MAG: MFS transporter [Proteobacteria bacterium]|nr:MFS transporter [Pseudomonadota bacterium]MBU1611326.1 MFS transporter [Pseudomonadota bacterium]
MTNATTRRMYIFLIVLAVASAAAFQGWRTLLNNFAVEVAGVDGVEMGIIQSLREVPGFLALLAVYLILILREHRLAAVSTLVLGLGVALTGLLPSFGGIVVTTMLMSFGFHYYETMSQSLTLQYFGVREAPLVMGRLRSLGALTNVVTGGAVWLMAARLGYPVMFAVAGGVAMAAGLWAMVQDPSSPDLPPQHKKIFLKRKYWLFYILTFLSGARRQIFVAFAVFLLVTRFGYSVQAVTVLFVGNNVLNYFANPLIGKAVNRFGERKVLSLEYFALVFIFVGYALTENAWLAGALYVLDNLFFNFAMSIRTFYQKIAEPGDIASGMATGFTVNHIAAVFIPALGGLAWMADHRLVFYGAACLAGCSLVLVQFIDRELGLARDRNREVD